jgi:hypothetical protein
MFGRLLVSVLLAQSISAQTRSLPMPVCGWDSLQRSIVYPELPLRAGIRAAYMVTIDIGSLGTLDSITVSPFSETSKLDNVTYSCPFNPLDSLFIEVIHSALRGTQWIPGRFAGNPTAMRVELPVVFNYYSSEAPVKHWPIIIKQMQRWIKKTRTY